MFSALAEVIVVFAIFFYGMGESKLGKRCQFMDFAHGNDYFDGQLLGFLLERMDWGFQKNLQYISFGYWSYPCLDCDRGKSGIHFKHINNSNNIKSKTMSNINTNNMTFKHVSYLWDEAKACRISRR